MSPKIWIRTVYFQRYLKLDILARLDAVYSMYVVKTSSHHHSMGTFKNYYAPLLKNGIPSKKKYSIAFLLKA